MKLNHLSLAVPNVTEAAAFLEKFFAFKTVTNKGNMIIAMENNENFVLVLTTQRQGESAYPADFHFGFFRGNEQEVLALYEQLTSEGIEVPRQPAKIRDRFGFYFYMPGNIMLEVSCNLQ